MLSLLMVYLWVLSFLDNQLWMESWRKREEDRRKMGREKEEKRRGYYKYNFEKSQYGYLMSNAWSMVEG